MHELSVAMSIVEGAEEEVSRQGGGRVTAVYLKLGPLSGVVKDALLFSYELACAGTSLEGSTLVIEEIPVRIHCTVCEGERAAVSMQALQCAECGAPAASVVHGAELELSALELQT